MATGNVFRDGLIEEIKSWKINGLKIYKEVAVGDRFAGNKRKLDIVLQYGEKSLGIEAKYQESPGTAYEKIVYALEDARRTPIKTIVVVSGGTVINPGMLAHITATGFGIVVDWTPSSGFVKGRDVFKQRVMIELGLDWLEDQKNQLVD